MFLANTDVISNQPVAVVVLLMFLGAIGWFTKEVLGMFPKVLDWGEKQIDKITERFEKALEKMGLNFSVCMMDLKGRVDDIDGNIDDIKECQKKIVEKIDSFHKVENFSK